MNERLTAYGYTAAWKIVRTLPRQVTWPVFAGAAGYAARRPGTGTRRLAVNLRRVVGPAMPDDEFDALLRAAVRSYARYWLEAFRLPSRSKAQLLTDFRLERGHLLGEDAAAGRGAIIALPHGGNWDAAGAWVAAQGWPITTVAERLKPESVYERFLAFRRGLGMEIVPLTGGERSAMEVLTERLREGGLVPLLADRDISTRGIEVDFFGGKARMPAGPAILALRTGAPLYVVSMWYEPDAACGYMEGPLPIPDGKSFGDRVRTLTQQIADRLATGIAEHPQDWHMLQRVWIDEPAPAVAPAGSGT